MTRCKIQWIGRDGKPTPDTNPAVAEVRIGPHYWYGRPELDPSPVFCPPSEWFPVCAAHLADFNQQRLVEHNWELRPLTLEPPV
uniref:Uncharacterized protein n=1 Tax=viral metagenome TaxID=1070528 RepID=A0A6M3L7C3_9ZZZZ